MSRIVAMGEEVCKSTTLRRLRGLSVEIERSIAQSVISRLAEEGDRVELGSRLDTRTLVPLEGNAVQNALA
jgi:hypothetical protein